MSVKLDEKDLAILALIQEDSQLTAKRIARKINAPLTTVFAKTKRMEQQGIIKSYRAILAPEKLGQEHPHSSLPQFHTDPKPMELLFLKEPLPRKLPSLLKFKKYT